MEVFFIKMTNLPDYRLIKMILLGDYEARRTPLCNAIRRFEIPDPRRIDSLSNGIVFNVDVTPTYFDGSNKISFNHMQKDDPLRRKLP